MVDVRVAIAKAVLAVMLEPHNDDCDLSETAARRVETALKAAGLAVVPIEPTEEMLDAAWKGVNYDIDLGPEQLNASWTAMISASSHIEKV